MHHKLFFLNIGSNQMLSTPQDELLDIIHDFKKNVLSINQVENLVETWKNRNDVQQSFKEKQVNRWFKLVVDDHVNTFQ
jgi:quinol monooxygenase YgiN